MGFIFYSSKATNQTLNMYHDLHFSRLNTKMKVYPMWKKKELKIRKAKNKNIYMNAKELKVKVYIRSFVPSLCVLRPTGYRYDIFQCLPPAHSASMSSNPHHIDLARNERISRLGRAEEALAQAPAPTLQRD